MIMVAAVVGAAGDELSRLWGSRTASMSPRWCWRSYMTAIRTSELRAGADAAGRLVAALDSAGLRAHRGAAGRTGRLQARGWRLWNEVGWL